MTFDPDDPRLTAYALGELEPADHAEIEGLLSESDEALRHVEEIRQTARWLSDEFRKEREALPDPVAGQPPAHRRRHQEAAPRARRPSWWRRHYRLLATAATVVLGGTIGLATWTALERGRVRTMPVLAGDYAPHAAKSKRAPGPESPELFGRRIDRFPAYRLVGFPPRKRQWIAWRRRLDSSPSAPESLSRPWRIGCFTRRPAPGPCPGVPGPLGQSGSGGCEVIRSTRRVQFDSQDAAPGRKRHGRHGRRDGGRYGERGRWSRHDGRGRRPGDAWPT